jgi:hypothetical protein
LAEEMSIAGEELPLDEPPPLPLAVVHHPPILHGPTHLSLHGLSESMTLSFIKEWITVAL